jgi:hypothetical protein
MSLRGALSIGVIAFAVAGWAMAVWADDRGIRPRPTPNDYPARQTIDGVTFAAAVLTPEQVKRRFATDLNRGYIVVEMAIFPEGGHETEMASRDFLARFGSSTEMERPLGAQAIAARLGKKDPGAPSNPDSLSKVHVYNAETIGYEHGPNGRSGVYTATTTGVSVGDRGTPPPPAQAPSGMTRHEVEQELDGLALPERRIAEETAGYLYFAKPTKGKASPVHLAYYGEQKRVDLEFTVK